MSTTYADVLAYNRASFADRTAITIDDRALSFPGLAALVEQARRLLARHVAPGDRVAIWMPNSFAWVATFLAVRSLGAALVPVNTRLTVAELGVILNDCLPSALVTMSGHRGRDYLAEVHAGGILCRVTIDASDDVEPQDWRVFTLPGNASSHEPGTTLTDLLCIQYTSGTTSVPKGVMLTESMYLRTAAYTGRCQGLTPSSHFMSAVPFFHCSGMMHALTTCLLAGSTLHSMSAWDVEKFLHLTQMHRGNVGHGIFMRDVIAYGVDKARPYLSTVRTLNATGSLKDLRVIHDELGITGISDLYGMTEVCGNFTMWYPDDPLEKRITGNGRPQPGNYVRAVNVETGSICKSGEDGEIQLKGHTLTPGYFGKPEMTADAFTSDGWLKTGDLGAISDRNELFFKSRLKEIIRVGGENLSPTEIEDVIRDLSGLRHVCVVAVPHERLGEVPVVVVVCEKNGIDWKSVLDMAKERLAGFKMPRAVYLTDGFPVTATNRVQRATLQREIADGKLNRVV
jgi:acyl-CoA synthetase (AMP-forming)/AMP-acid ligase II